MFVLSIRNNNEQTHRKYYFTLFHRHNGHDDANAYAHEQIGLLCYLCTCAPQFFQHTFLFLLNKVVNLFSIFLFAVLLLNTMLNLIN
jgi:hypothetical protein